MRRVAGIAAALLVGFGIVFAASATEIARYQARVVSQSPYLGHPPYFNGTFWLGDHLWLYFRDQSLGRGIFRKYRVCWSYESFSGRGCKTGLASRRWQEFPPRIKNRFNSHMLLTWYVNGEPVLKKRLRITGE